MKRRAWAALVLVPLVVVACSSGGKKTPTTAASGGGSSSGVNQSSFRIAVVTHGQASDPFWSVVANGIKAAAADEGVTADYNAPQTFDMVAMSQLIDAAVASKPDGLIVSIPDADALGPSIKKAVAAGIPVISINSGSDTFKSLGVLAHIGQTEEVAGQLAGAKMKEAGVTKAICVNQEVGNAALDLRCKGFSEGLGFDAKVVPVDLNDPGGITQTIAGAIQSDPDINGILTLGPTASTPALQALDAANATDKIHLATFDLSTDVLNAINDGKMLFAIDQAQYLQGYLAIVYMTQFLKTGAVAPGSAEGVTLTGPQFVTKDNAADVIKFTQEGVR
ncbi:MAG TPA: sugar ABC transporter substrate-binding protein [Actinomycetota bacterium]|nr:sugar ABC transporter substrate-binding protein [Actinomycetota bacterium]